MTITWDSCGVFWGIPYFILELTKFTKFIANALISLLFKQKFKSDPLVLFNYKKFSSARRKSFVSNE